MTPIRAAIVDDEAPARSRIRDLLRAHADIEIVLEAADGQQALRDIPHKRPALLFLDVQMPEIDGFAVLEALPTGLRPPGIVFVTAYDVHAIRAFDVNAVDYLLKPYTAERFNEALARARTRLGTGAAAQIEIERLLQAVAARSSPAADRLALKTADGVRFLRIAEIDWLQADGNHTILHSGSASLRTREPLSDLEERVAAFGFLRIHRSIVVNVDRIFKLEPWAHGEYLIVLRNGTKLNSGRAYGEHVRALMGRT